MMNVTYLQNLYQSLCIGFDKEVREKHNEEIRVMFGICPDHFFQRMIERINGEGESYGRERVLAAAFKYILTKYSFFSKLKQPFEFAVGYQGWKICYKCRVVIPDSQPRYIEVVPVTVFRHVKK